MHQEIPIWFIKMPWCLRRGWLDKYSTVYAVEMFLAKAKYIMSFVLHNHR